MRGIVKGRDLLNCLFSATKRVNIEGKTLLRFIIYSKGFNSIDGSLCFISEVFQYFPYIGQALRQVSKSF